MDYKYIEQLLQRYFEAGTTLKEEQILRVFFEQPEEELPVELRQFKPLFGALGQDNVLGDDFDERLLQMTEDAIKVKARTISMAERLKPLLRAAAAVAIILTLSNALNQSFKDSGTWTDKEQFASYADALRNAALAASEDSALLLSEDLILRSDTLVTDSLYDRPTGYLE